MFGLGRGPERNTARRGSRSVLFRTLVCLGLGAEQDFKWRGTSSKVSCGPVFCEQTWFKDTDTQGELQRELNGAVVETNELSLDDINHA